MKETSGLVNWISRVNESHGFSYEIILIDDGSTDRSWEVIGELARENPHIRGAKFNRNYGKSAALDTGFHLAQGEVEAAVFGGGDAVDVFELARGCPTPALFLWAARGNFARQTYEDLAASMGDARVETVDCGHLVPMERPDRVVEAVRREAGAR